MCSSDLCLVNANPDLLAGRHVAVHQMRLDQLLRDVHTHDSSPNIDKITE